MINGVIFLEEQADYLLLLGKEGLYTVQAENDHWNVHYTLPGDTSNLDKQFISKDEALQDIYEMDIWRRNRWKFLSIKELRTSLKELLTSGQDRCQRGLQRGPRERQGSGRRGQRPDRYHRPEGCDH